MTRVEFALIAVMLAGFALGWWAGKSWGSTSVALERERERGYRDALAREIDERIAAFNCQPRGNVGEVLPFVPRDGGDAA